MNFIDASSLSPVPTPEEQQAVSLRICNIVTKYGRYRLNIPVKTWQANIAILCALERMQNMVEHDK